jgi:MFS family permease
VVAAFGTTPAFAVNCLSFVVFTSGLLAVHPRPANRLANSSLRESIRILSAEPMLLIYLAVVVTVSFVTDPINTESPAIAHLLGLPATWAGAIVGLFGGGAVLAGFTIAGRIAAPRRLAVTLVAMGIGIAGQAFAHDRATLLAFAAIAGFGYLSSNAAATTLLQLGVAEGHRGRVMALWSVAFLGSRPLASFLDGTIASALGVRAALIVMALPAFAVAAVLILVARSRPLASPGSLRPPESAGD